VCSDGIDLREIDVASWRTRIAAVFQDFVRYELPLRENVAPLGASDEDVRQALSRAQASDFAELDQVLSKMYEGGTDLSGGQWQRIALARALCSVQLGAGIVLLDEPTAQLDVRGEAEIFDRLLDATRGRTVVLISHRFSTVRHADRICVLEHGRVVELGSHDELMAHDGRYKTMFDLQASRFYVDEELLDAAET
jgi:ABC-type multidrug transport system fused ATPase/permease subunit